MCWGHIQMKARLRDIRLFDLDTQTVLLITKFVRIARTQERASIRLNDSAVVERVVKLGIETENAELRALFHSIRRPLRKHLASKSVIEAANSFNSISQGDDARQ